MAETKTKTLVTFTMYYRGGTYEITIPDTDELTYRVELNGETVEFRTEDGDYITEFEDANEAMEAAIRCTGWDDIDMERAHTLQPLDHVIESDMLAGVC